MAPKLTNDSPHDGKEPSENMAQTQSMDLEQEKKAVTDSQNSPAANITPQTDGEKPITSADTQDEQKSDSLSVTPRTATTSNTDRPHVPEGPPLPDTSDMPAKPGIPDKTMAPEEQKKSQEAGTADTGGTNIKEHKPTAPNQEENPSGPLQSVSGTATAAPADPGTASDTKTDTGTGTGIGTSMGTHPEAGIAGA